MKPEVTSMSAERAELFNRIQNYNQYEVERLLGIARVLEETEQKKFWDSLGEEELTEEEELKLEEAEKNAQYVPLTEFLEKTGYNEDGTKK